MYKILISLIAFLSFFSTVTHGVFARSGETIEEFRSHIDVVVKLNKTIQSTRNTSALIELFRERNRVVEQAKDIYYNIELRSLAKPTLDVSKSYLLALQKYSLSCEIAALRIAIEAATGKYYSEEKILDSLRHVPGPLQDGVWGDPDKEFVGSYRGSQNARTGYGIYEAPLQHYLTSIGVGSRYTNRLTGSGVTGSSQLHRALDALHEGKHVVLWGDWCTVPKYDDGLVSKADTYIVNMFPIAAKNTCARSINERLFSWKTPTGKQVDAISGEHAFLLLGYAGPRESPSHIMVWDTDTGKHTYPLHEWIRKWNLLDYRMLIIEEKDLPGKK